MCVIIYSHALFSLINIKRSHFKILQSLNLIVNSSRTHFAFWGNNPDTWVAIVPFESTLNNNELKLIHMIDSNHNWVGTHSLVDWNRLYSQRLLSSIWQLPDTIRILIHIIEILSLLPQFDSFKKSKIGKTCLMSCTPTMAQCQQKTAKILITTLFSKAKVHSFAMGKHTWMLFIKKVQYSATSQGHLNGLWDFPAKIQWLHVHCFN